MRRASPRASLLPEVRYSVFFFYELDPVAYLYPVLFCFPEHSRCKASATVEIDDGKLVRRIVSELFWRRVHDRLRVNHAC